MSNRNKAAGAAFVSALVEVAQKCGFPYAEARAQHGNKDRGDLLLGPAVVCEAKYTPNNLDVSGALKEAQVEKENAGAQIGFAVIKRRGKHAREAYAVFRAEDAFLLLKEAGY